MWSCAGPRMVCRMAPPLVSCLLALPFLLLLLAAGRCTEAKLLKWGDELEVEGAWSGLLLDRCSMLPDGATIPSPGEQTQVGRGVVGRTKCTHNGAFPHRHA